MTVEADNVSEQLQCRKMHSEDMVRGGGGILSALTWSHMLTVISQ
jgi:hypothetical protein